MSNKIIEVQNIKVNITNIDDNDYICISDFCKYKEGKSKADDIIRNWLRNRITLEFLGTWESIYNPNFNSVEFDGFRKSAGLHTFTLSVTEWCEKTNAIGIYSKRGKYGGTYAHKEQEKVYDIVNWRFIQHLGDIRNLCDHNKDREPTKEEVEELINGTEKVIKTIF